MEIIKTHIIKLNVKTFFLMALNIFLFIPFSFQLCAGAECSIRNSTFAFPHSTLSHSYE